MAAIPGIAGIEKRLLEMQKRKDGVLAASREMVRLAGRSITLMHARKLAAAGSSLRKLDSLERKMRNMEKGFEYFSMQAHQEYVEARALSSILKESRLVSAAELHVGGVPYLLGIMDLSGELKREVIEAIRNGDIRAAKLYHGFMKEIYDSTRSLRFANSLVPEFRRKQDVARIQLENADSELLAATGGRRYV